ncbi:hydroxyacylglutathione hydrolase [Marinospirillum alkaliphilum]|uniref:Hydroxyacylglutathione hydrolase n=1 Tax=Marinospirillum alkaliphilum DSM 21637 TaxID=1122209 RepID=A0A1K1WZN5_9GAMM|nr:hydroxyacylglutathione hydrolase [Marinospirillum alkaliphilum]SFX42515.1 hydroxyacylglutathione hydrolase [Marinospirillum alkaliphilum DSM 21637]
MLDVITLPAFNDNYIWLLKSRGDKRCWVVDPGEAEPVQHYLKTHELTLEGILLTHHHADHIGGVAALMKAGVTVVGSVQDVYRLPPLNLQVTQGDRFQLLGHTVQVLEVPGHTLGHIAYFIEDQHPPLLFCGDTLFAGGCGRLFEGTPEQMHASLQALARLPDTTRVYPAHEYTLSNLKFALQVEPDNLQLQQRMTECQQLRDKGQPTLPSTLADEKATNPFLRISQPTVVRCLARRFPDQPATAPAEGFALLRGWKDKA